MHNLEFITLPNGTIQVNAEKCGMKFEEIAFIHYPNRLNACIQIPKPLGTLAIIEILVKSLSLLREQYPEQEYEFENNLLMGSEMSLASSHYSLKTVIETI